MKFSHNVISYNINIFMSIGDCGPPVAADGVVIHNYTTTFEGSSITFTCEDGLFSNVTITATCTGEGNWNTDPATYMCTNITDTTTITTATTGTNSSPTATTGTNSSPTATTGTNSSHTVTTTSY